MSGGVRLHRHRPERARDCSKNPAPPSALRARSVFPAISAGQRNLRSSRTRDFKSSASTTVEVSVGMRKDNAADRICQTSTFDPLFFDALDHFLAVSLVHFKNVQRLRGNKNEKVDSSDPSLSGNHQVV